MVAETSSRQPVLKWSSSSSYGVGSNFAASLNAARPNELQVVLSGAVFDRNGSRLYSTDAGLSYVAANLDQTPNLELIGSDDDNMITFANWLD